VSNAAITILIELIEKNLQECWSALDAEQFDLARTALDLAKEKISQIAAMRQPSGREQRPKQLTIAIEP
jgi:hypothetical protein